MTSRLEQLLQLKTVTCDGNLISKSDRDELMKSGLASRYNGWNWLSIQGVRTLEDLGFLKP